MSFLETIKSQDGEIVGYEIQRCPGCGAKHLFITNRDRAILNAGGKKIVWDFNGDVESPTFTPSLLTVGHEGSPYCHFNLIDGVFHFHNDCVHDAKNKQLKYNGWDITQED